jgi:hypothetical protein
LRKRAAAHGVGDEQLEALLRDQIRWALPMERGLVTLNPSTEAQTGLFSIRQTPDITPRLLSRMDPETSFRVTVG